jgi:hypothetical protein
MAEESVSEPKRNPEREPNHAAPTSSRRSSLSGAAALPIAALVVAVVALVLAGWAWFHPRSSNAPEAKTESAAGQSADPEAYTDAQRAEAKAKTCTTFRTVDAGVRRNTNLAPQGGDTEIGVLATAANWRLSVYDGGQYLLDRLEPGTPSDIADPVRSLGTVLMDIGAAATAGVPESDPVQAPRIQEAERLMNSLLPLCQ